MSMIGYQFDEVIEEKCHLSFSEDEEMPFLQVLRKLSDDLRYANRNKVGPISETMSLFVKISSTPDMFG